MHDHLQDLGSTLFSINRQAILAPISDYYPPLFTDSISIDPIDLRIRIEREPGKREMDTAVDLNEPLTC